VIYDGYEHVLKWNADRSALNSVDLPRPFVLLVGSKAPHKNVAIIYSIAAELAARGIYVLVTGGADNNVYARENDRQLPPNVKHLGRVDDNDLAFLYRQALCLVFPSRTEGFGLPALEAMALGCPVISTNAASLPEVCGDTVLYAPPEDALAWLAAIGRMSDDPVLRNRLADAGPKRSKAFSWRDGAEKYLKLMFALDRGTGDGSPSESNSAKN
jgi:glycosyltransferase involved in cell wall biosynthesis